MPPAGVFWQRASLFAAEIKRAVRFAVHILGKAKGGEGGGQFLAGCGDFGRVEEGDQDAADVGQGGFGERLRWEERAGEAENLGFGGGEELVQPGPEAVGVERGW